MQKKSWFRCFLSGSLFGFTISVLALFLSGCGEEERKIEPASVEIIQDIVEVKEEPAKKEKAMECYKKISAPDFGQFMKLPGGASINVEDSIVSIPMQLVNPDGGLEFILTRGLSKDYESILSTTVFGKNLHFAMVTVGFEASSFDKNEKDYSKKIAKQASAGSKMEIWVKFDGDSEARPLTHLLRWNSGQLVRQNNWFFAGSYFEKHQNKNIYMGDDSLNLIAAYSSLEMVVGPCFGVENPYDDKASEFLVINKEKVPALGSQGVMYLCLKKDK